MDDAVLDYPLVKSAIKLPIPAREDKAPQPVVTQYRGWRDDEMAVLTGRYPTTRYGPLSWNQERDASTSFVVIWRICVILSSATASMAILQKPQRRRAFWPVVVPDASCQSA